MSDRIVPRTPPAVPAPAGSGGSAASGAVAPAAPGAVDWAEVRQAYEESDLSVKDLIALFAIRGRDLYDRLHQEGWRPRQPAGGSAPRPKPARRAGKPLDRTRLVARLFVVVDRQIAEIEARLARPDEATGAADEKDARTLAALARTLELLIGLEKQAAPAAAATEVDIDAFREDLARRIEGLRNQG